MTTRRSFLQLLAAVAAAMSLPNLRWSHAAQSRDLEVRGYVHLRNGRYDSVTVYPGGELHVSGDCQICTLTMVGGTAFLENIAPSVPRLFSNVKFGSGACCGRVWDVTTSVQRRWDFSNLACEPTSG